MTQDRDDFYAGICVALQVITSADYGTIWAELVRTVDIDRLLDYAAFVEPEEWKLAGFGRYAKIELGRSRPTKRLPAILERRK